MLVQASQDALRHLEIIMVGTKFPENIGMAARACANTGCGRLTLVNPVWWDREKARPLATAKGEPLLDAVEVKPSLADALGPNVMTYGTTARTGGWRRGLLTPEQAAAEIDRQFALLDQAIPYRIIGYGDATLESAVGELLRVRGETVAAAESCTGGNIAHRFTALPGASDYFRGGVVAYSNDVKTALLGVNADDLNRCGAVSRPVAEQMAAGVRKATGATYGIATTGIAGPTGGTPDKPVGTVWMAVSGPDETYSIRMVFGSLRSQNIERASSNAINLLRLRLCGAPGNGLWTIRY